MARQDLLKSAAFFLTLGFAFSSAARSAQAQTSPDQNPPPIPEAVGPAAIEAPQPMGSENDVSCFGYVGEPVEQFTGMVISGDAVYEQSSFMFQDIVYTEN